MCPRASRKGVVLSIPLRVVGPIGCMDAPWVACFNQWDVRPHAAVVERETTAPSQAAYRS
jgi:hypothetical protein